MSLWEYGESNGSVSLMEMFDNPQEEIFATSELKWKKSYLLHAEVVGLQH